MIGPDVYLGAGAVAVALGVLFGFWALHHEASAVEAEARKAAQQAPELPLKERRDRPERRRAHA